MTTEASTQEERLELLSNPRIEVSCGLMLLDSACAETEDISSDLLDGRIEYECFDRIPGRCDLELSHELDWRNVRVRPYMTVEDGTYHLTQNLGLYVLSVPESELGETPATYRVEGYDLLKLLDRPIGDTYVVAASTGYLAAVETVISDSGVTNPGVALDSDKVGETLTSALVWPLCFKDFTYLDVITDLLKAVGYCSLYADRDGYLCSGPYQSPATQAPVWTFDLTDDEVQVVCDDRTMRRDHFYDYNWYRFVQSGLSSTPSEGSGMYTCYVDTGFACTGGSITSDGLYTVHTFNSGADFVLDGDDDLELAVEYLIVPGGGGGGGNGGGGGGGDPETGTLTLSAGTYSAVVGAGGAAGADTPTDGSNGQDSSFGGVTATGGGGGGVYAGVNGGTGGGGGGGGGAGGSGTDYDGGTGTSGSGGGGGGATEDGADGISGVSGGDGGDGYESSITGSAVKYGGGGGGCAYSTNSGAAGAGGAGGGGAGGKAVAGTAGTANTGGGGGGGGADVGTANKAGGAGGSGVVILRYRTPIYWKTVRTLVAEDQTALEAQGDAIVESEAIAKHVINISASPMHIFWHRDTVQYDDPETGELTHKAQISRWTLPFDAGDMEIDLEVVA